MAMKGKAEAVRGLLPVKPDTNCQSRGRLDLGDIESLDKASPELGLPLDYSGMWTKGSPLLFCWIDFVFRAVFHLLVKPWGFDTCDEKVLTVLLNIKKKKKIKRKHCGFT